MATNNLKQAVRKMTNEYMKEYYIPNVYQPSIYEIDYKKLKERGIQVISFDIDGTIAGNGATPTAFDVTRFESLKKLFTAVILVTNSNPKNAKAFAKILRVNCIAEAKKPHTACFKEIQKRYKVNKKQMAHVGNSLGNDIAGGNTFGIITCLVRNVGEKPKEKDKVLNEELALRKLWRKHHLYVNNDQYYQLDELPEYQLAPQYQEMLAKIAVVYDGKAPRKAAENIFKYIQDLGHQVDFMDAADYRKKTKDYGWVIIVGHHDLAKEHLQYVKIQYDKYGMKLGYRANVNQCVLTTSTKELEKEAKWKQKFSNYYNAEMSPHKKLAAQFKIPTEFGKRADPRESQYDLLCLKFISGELEMFLKGY